MSDFSDRPFVAGSLIGLRSFKVDRLGRLVGVSHPHVLKPGENIATCDGRAVGGFIPYHYFPPPTMFPSRRSTARQWLTSGANAAFTFDVEADADETDDDVAPEPPPHTLAGVDCSCGFYAYFDGSNVYAEPDTITGLIEGYGVCTVGSRGFRAEKTRLVALVDPDAKRWWDRCLNDPWVGFWFSVSVGIVVALIGFACLLAERWIVGGIDVALASVNAWMATRNWRRICAQKPSRFTRVRAAYPDVPVYRSSKQALAAHPLTKPERDPLPTPETHENFWDMAVPR